MATPFDMAQANLRNVQPIAMDGQFPDITALYQAGQQAHVGNALASAATNTANAQLAQQAKQAQFSRASAVASAQTALEKNKASQAAVKAAASGTGYSRNLNPSGGYTFTDPSGQEVTAFDYAHAKKQPLPSVLEGSLDPAQSGFAKDYASVLNMGKQSIAYAQAPSQLKTEGSTQQILQKYQKKQPLSSDEQAVLDYTLTAQAHPDIVSQTPQALLQHLFSAYPEIHDVNQYQAPISGSVNPDLPGSLATQGSSPPSILQRLLGALHLGGA